MNTLICALTLLAAPQQFRASDLPVPEGELIAISYSPALTQALKDDTMANLRREILDRYVSVEEAEKMAAALDSWMKTKEYSDIDDPAVFTEKVNALLQKQVTDAHLRFRYSEQPLPTRADPGEPSAEEIAQYERQIRYQNSLFEKVERLPGNVGYISFRGFQSPENMARPLTGAMNFLSETDVMIVDLRQNGGGDPSGVQLFCSYFFGETPVHLNSIYYRPTDELTEYWTLKDLPAPRFVDKPVYVLVSKQTGSGAEECAYNLKNLKRATIVGVPTWGGANPGGTVRLNDHFACFIPVGRAINPITKTNWEGTGVIPDVNVAPDEALTYAHLRALEYQIEREKNPGLREGLQQFYDQLKNGR